MSDYRDIFRTRDTQNWFRCSLAVLIAREGLVHFVKDEIEQFQQDILQKIIHTNSLPVGSTCMSCTTPSILPCQTRNVCQVRRGRCTFHTQPHKNCPNKICDAILQEVENEHHFKGPSWKNTDAKGWCSNAWELAKCFMPPDGYTNIPTADNTDFNGIISVLINCKRFEKKFSDDLTQVINLCTKAREVCRDVRHNADLKMDDITTTRTIDALINLLDDKKYLQADSKATDARGKLDKLKNDSLAITTANFNAVLDSVLDDKSSNMADKIQEMMSQKLQEFKSQLDDVESERNRTRANTKEDHYTKLKHELQQDLAKFYQERHSTMPLSPIIHEIDDHINKFYVAPKIKRLNPDTIISTFKEIFREDSRKKRSIYIQGEAGLGKSTFCARLILLWSEMLDKMVSKDDCGADTYVYNDKQTKTESESDPFTDNDILTQFDFVFSVALRDAKGECDIETMIGNQVINELARGKRYIDILSDILSTEKCLIILDGLDEWTHPSSTACQKSEKVPHIKLWNNTTVVTTTRPWKINDVRVKDSQMGMLIEITGLTNTSTFIRKVLQCLNDKTPKPLQVDDFMKEIKSRSVSEFLEVPLVLLQMLCLWHDGHELGESKCEIYSNMSDMMLARAEEKAPSEGDSDSSLLSPEMPCCFRSAHCCKRNRELLDSLGRLAFSTLHFSDKGSRLVFSESVVKNHIPSDYIVQQALNSGIISQHKSPSLTARKSTFCFLHKSFQEFLAAYFIATNTTDSENVMEIIQQVYGTRMNIFSMSQLFLFVCGMNPNVASLMSVLVSERDLGNKLAFRYLNEQQMLIAGYKEGVKNGHHDIRLSMSKVSYTNNISHDEKIYLDQLVIINNDKIVTFGIRIDTLSTLTNKTSMFDIRSDEPNIELNKQYAQLLPGGELQHPIEGTSSSIDLGKVPKTCNVIARTLVSQVIPTLTSLRMIDICSVDLGDTDIPLPNTVQYIKLLFVKMTSKACRHLRDSILHMPHQVRCELWVCTVTPEEEFDDIKKQNRNSCVFTIDPRIRSKSDRPIIYPF